MWHGLEGVVVADEVSGLAGEHGCEGMHGFESVLEEGSEGEGEAE